MKLPLKTALLGSSMAIAGPAVALDSDEAKQAREIAANGFPLDAAGRKKLNVKIGSVITFEDGTKWRITADRIIPYIKGKKR